MSDVGGFVLTIAGCPTAWGTPRTASGVTSSDPLWWSPTISETLLWPDFQITERAKLLSGDLDVDSIQITLLDDGTLGALFLTNASYNVSSRITADVSAGATTISVQSGAVFTAGNDAWLERECVHISSISTNTLTVVRGKYGTQAVAHSIDSANNRNPELFSKPPWLGVQRHAYLWAVRADTGVAFPVWIGKVRRPRVEGGKILLEGEHLWSVLRNIRVGEHYGGVDLIGVGAFDVSATALVEVRDSSSTPVMRAVASTTIYLEAFEAVRAVVNTAVDRMNTLWGSTARSPSVTRISASRAIATLSWTGNPSSVSGAGLAIAGDTSFREAAYYTDGTTRTLVWDLADLPSCAYVVSEAAVPTQYFGIQSALSLPSTWDGSSTTVEGRVTRANRVLRGAVSDDFWVVMSGVAIDGANSVMTAHCAFVRRNPAADDTSMQGPLGRMAVITQPHLEVVLQVAADHWAEGWRYGVIPELSRDTWADHWDWSRMASLTRHTSWGGSRRVSYYDSSLSVGDSLTSDCLVTGCTPVVRSAGRLALWDWRLPGVAETSVATYSSSTIVGDVTPWDLYDEGLANSIHLKAEKFDLQVNMTQSFERYGRGTEIVAELKGGDGDRIRTLNPSDLKNSLLRRLQLWSEPIYSVTVEVPLSECETVYVGDTITITEWSAPDGSGGRGLSSEKAVVWARSLDFGSGKLRLECLLFGRLSYPYGPSCVFKSKISSTVYEVLDNPFNGTSAYDGTTGSGLSQFVAGHAVEIRERDNTSPLVESAVIASVDTVTVPNRVTFVSALSASAQTLISSGTAWVSMRLDRYVNQVSQLRTVWAWVGDDTTDVIDSTADRAQRIAP